VENPGSNYPDLEPGKEFWNQVRVRGSDYKSRTNAYLTAHMTGSNVLHGYKWITQRQQQSTPGRRVIMFKQKRRVPQTPTQLVPTHSDSVGYLKIYNIYNYKSLTL